MKLLVRTYDRIFKLGEYEDFYDEKEEQLPKLVIVYDFMKKKFIDPVSISSFLINNYKGLDITNSLEFLWFKILKGEPSDNIEGVSGIGEKR